MKDLDSTDLGQYLTEQGLHEDAVATIVDNRISGELFMDLTGEDLKDMFPIVGDRMSVHKILQNIQQVASKL